MAITARNYASWAERALVGSPVDREACDLMLETLRGAQHFSLPDGGMLLEDNLRGIKCEEVRLPYPKITIEFFCPTMEVSNQLAQVHAPKRLIIAREFPFDEALKFLKPEFKHMLEGSSHGIFISCVNGFNGIWQPNLSAWLLPSRWEAAPGTNRDILGRECKKGIPLIAGIPLVPFVDALERVRELRPMSGDDVMRMAANDIIGEVSVTLGLCEAMSCSNVRAVVRDPVDPHMNARRVANGKWKMYETKILNVDVPAKSGDSGGASAGGTHASPRQHLRRGHIRRLTDKKVWVNSCIVGSADNGIIDKSYNLRTGE